MPLRKTVLKIAEELLGLPTAPFREHRVREYIKTFCKARRIAVREDDFGNVIASCGANRTRAVFAFDAHMDHPGFIIERDSVRMRTTALFYGGVRKEYFKTANVRVFSDDGEVVGRVTRTQIDRKKRVRRVWLTLKGDVKRGDVAMWDLVAFRVRNDRLHSRACDDVVGCVAVLAMFDEVRRRRIRKKVLGVFTVAEEAGANGAGYLAMKRGIPRSAPIIAMETSRETPVARIGDGAVIRVGDRTRIFDPAITRFMEHAATRLARRSRRFKYQRALMDGGTCEASIYQAFGYRVGAACVPLGNYHNHNTRTKKIAAEYVSVDDLVNMVKLFVAMVQHSRELDRFMNERPPKFTEERRALGERLWV